MPVKNCLHKVTPAVHSVVLISLTPWVTMPLQYTCKSGGNLIVRHNCLRGTFCESCKLHGMHYGSNRGRLWPRCRGKLRSSRTLLGPYLGVWQTGSIGFHHYITAINHSTLNEASVMTRSATAAAELRKHATNDQKCNPLGWACIPVTVEAYGCW